MAQGSSKTKGRRTASRGKNTSGRKAGNGASKDAITLLKADHREVEGWFEQFEKAKSDDRKLELAQKICKALTTHATIEEEIFYPAFLEATEEEDIHHEAEVEHAGAKNLIAQIEASGPEDEYYDAKVTVLSEMIKHHVKEEEQPGGMFAKARKSDMDLKELGARLQTRKDEVMSEIESSGPAASTRSLTAGLFGKKANREGARRPS